MVSPLRTTIRRRAVCFLALLIVMARAQAPAQIAANAFGMNLSGSTLKANYPWPTGMVGAIRLWDSGVAWNAIEPSPGAFDWSLLDRWLERAAANHMDVLYVFGRTPRWASSQPGLASCAYGPGQCAPPADLAAWDSYVRAMVTHAHGRIRYWEIWNEANDPHFWTGTAAEMAMLARHAYGIIKSVDPQAVVLTPSFATGAGGVSQFVTWAKAYFSLGAAAYADVLAFHGYAGPDATNVLPLIDAYRKVVGQFGQAGKPIWDTEASWGVDHGLTNEARQAGFVAQFYLLQLSTGIERLYWYAWRNGKWGTIADQNGPRRAGVAYQQVNRWLVGASFARPCGQTAAGVWSCLLTRPGGYQAMAVWARQDQSFTPPANFHTLRDLAGRAHAVAGAVTITAEPVLLESDPARLASR